MAVRGPSRAGRPCRQGRTITKARPPPPPPARAQASTPRACRVSRSHTPCPCYPPSHHLTLPTPSNYKSCQARLCQAPNHTRPAVPPPTIALALVPAPRRRTCTGCRAIGGTRRRPSPPPAHSATLRDDNRALLVSAVSPPRAPPCAGAPLPGRASHRAPARTTLQPLVTAHCHTGLGPWVGLAAWVLVRRMRAVCLHASRRQCGPYARGQKAGLRAAGGNVTVECEMQAAAWGMANGRRMRR